MWNKNFMKDVKEIESTGVISFFAKKDVDGWKARRVEIMLR